MKKLVLFALGSLSVCMASAQDALPPAPRTRARAVTAQPAVQTVAATESAVPLTTVVPVQETPVQVVDSTTIIEAAKQSRREARAERRAKRADTFATTVDSLVRSKNFFFYPVSMAELPDGSQSNIFADYYYFGFFDDTAEVHLPMVNGVMQNVSMLNFDSDIADYQLLPFQSGLTTTFTLKNGSMLCFGRFVFSKITGETVLTLVTPDSSMRYVGWMSRERLHASDDDLKAESR